MYNINCLFMSLPEKNKTRFRLHNHEDPKKNKDHSKLVGHINKMFSGSQQAEYLNQSDGNDDNEIG